MKKPEAKLRDPLTGAYVRSYFQERLDEEIKRGQRQNLPLTLVLIDLDHFKSINDAFGHVRGDQVLAEFGQRVLATIRSYDLFFRYGGDEFVLLLPGADKLSATALAQRVLEVVRTEPVAGEAPVHLTLSMGVAVFPDEAVTAAGLFERADARAYMAKRQGRAQLVNADSTPEFETQAKFNYASRLIEREAAMDALNRFLDEVPESKRGLFLVSAPLGAGRSRFLQETGQAARLRGYEVLSLSGDVARRTRVYGAFSELAHEWGKLPSPTLGQSAFVTALQEHLINKGRAGLCILVDNVAEMDLASLDFLDELISSDSLSSTMLVCSGEANDLLHWRQVEISLREEVVLGALSEQGVRLWLRGVLRWEAPEAFRHWLYEMTGGLPRLLQRALMYLVEEGVITNTAQGWVVSDSYPNKPLKRFLTESGQPPAYNLPTNLSLFIGREDELQLAKRQLVRQSLVTLAGQGGMGKTRLAIQITAEMQGIFQHGVCYVPLANVSVPELIVPAIAQALSFDFHGGRNPHLQLLDYLRSKKLLLVLDNFEHLLEYGTSLVTEILQAAPHLKILATCREQLGVAGEFVIELKGLPYPSTSSAYAEHYAAVQLFQLRAQKKTNVSESTTDQHHITRICQLVDGLPLGLELAAAWTSTFTCEEIASEIERNMDFLGGTESQRGLRGIFDYLWGTLLGEEKSVLSKLSIFRGGFRLDTARQVAHAAPFFISALFEKGGLVKISGNRYALPEVFRQYAEARFAAIPEEQAHTLQAHGQHYLSFLESLANDLEGAQQAEALQRISEEFENVRAAWHWAVRERQLPELRRGMFSLFHYYEIKSLYHDGRALFGQAIAMLEDLAAQPDRELHLLLGHMLAFRGALTGRLSLLDPARKDLEHARTILTEMGGTTDQAFVAMHLGLLANSFSEWETADIELNTALQLYRAANSQMGLAQALAGLGRNFWGQDRPSEARPYAEAALTIYVSFGNQRGQATVLNILGNIAWDLGEYDNGQQYYERSLGISRELGDRNRMALTLNNLGYTQYLLGNYELAGQFLRESLKVWEMIGERSGEALALNNLGYLAYLQGDYSQAELYNQRSLELRSEFGTSIDVAFSKHIMALLLTVHGEYAQARQLSEEALASFRSLQNPITSSNVLAHLAYLAALEENWAEAEQLGEEALALSRASGDPHNRINVLNMVGSIRVLQSMGESAIVLLREALALALPIHWPREILETLGIFGEALYVAGDTQQAAQILTRVAEDTACSAFRRTHASAQLMTLKSQYPEVAWALIHTEAQKHSVEDIARTLLEHHENG